VGGVQEVTRQIAERLAARGHQVTVATAKLPTRNFVKLNEVSIKEFDVHGNLVGGISGDVEEYREFVLAGKFDVIMIYAAQQWTFDALWPILDQIPCPKIFVPCGFSGLYEREYENYFQQLPGVLRKFDHLIFHATQYRDIDFARKHGIERISVIANAASEKEFNVAADPSFRSRHDIPEHSFVFLTVGSFTGLKGHTELAKAFYLLPLSNGEHATLILNGNEVQFLEASLLGLLGRLIGLVKNHGSTYLMKQILKKLSGASASPRKIAGQVNKSQPNKRVMITNFPRTELIKAFFAADLFVFASNIECSPLVLFEAAAAGIPFLTVDVGNSAEIAQWTGAGVMCPSAVNGRGYTTVNELVLAQSMRELMQQPERLKQLGAAGRRNWSERFTWEEIAAQYERLFSQLVKESSLTK
jgi:glycosyltransferase involved in cell wall biosynthesis